MKDINKQESQWLNIFEKIHQGTVIESLGVTLVSINSEQVVLKMPITDLARQPYGLLHGGISMLLAETAASMHASWGMDITKVQPVGIEINSSHVRSAKDGVVRAEGKVISRTRSLIVHQVNIVLDETNQLLSSARVTNFYRSTNKDGK